MSSLHGLVQLIVLVTARATLERLRRYPQAGQEPFLMLLAVDFLSLLARAGVDFAIVALFARRIQRHWIGHGGGIHQ